MNNAILSTSGVDVAIGVDPRGRGGLSLLALLTVVCLAHPALAQTRDTTSAATPTTGGGSIVGTVVLHDEPATRVRRVIVTLNPEGGGEGRTTLTTDAGAFEFANLEPGRYLLAARKAGYLRANYGATRPERSGTAIAITAGARVTVQIPLTRGAVITGTVRDLHGDPASGINVQLMRVRGEGANRRIDSQTDAMTDDRGVYRAFGLPPGDYLVAAHPRIQHSRDVAMLETTAGDVAWAEGTARGGDRPDASTVWLAPVYYPGIVDARAAETVPVSAGAERTGIDIGLRLQPAVRVSGSVRNPDGTPANDAMVYLMPADQSLALGHGGFLETSGAEFEFSNVPPGTYVVMARSNDETATTPSAAVTWASATIAVSPGPAPPIALTLLPAFTIDGRIVWADTTSTTPIPPLRVILEPVPGDQRLSFLANAEIQPDGRFLIPGVTPGRYTIRALPTEVASFWSVQSMSSAGRDITDLPLDITPGFLPSTVTVSLTPEPTDLEGSITTPDGRAAPDYHVVVFPADRRYWIPYSRRIRAVRPATDGRFSFEDLPPADYYLAALTDVEPREWFDPVFLDRLIPLALRVRVAEGTTTVQDIRIAK